MDREQSVGRELLMIECQKSEVRRGILATRKLWMVYPRGVVNQVARYPKVYIYWFVTMFLTKLAR